MSNPINIFTGLRNSLRKYLPKWLSQRPATQGKPALDVGYRFLYSIAVYGDALLELLTEGTWARLPGYSLGFTGVTLDPSTALPYIGRSRGLIRGESDTDASYAEYLRGWLDDAEQMGSPEILARSIQHYVGNTPTVRVVDRAGNWVTITPDGTATLIPAGSAAWTWDWDSVSNPERSGNSVPPGDPWWSDMWIIVYPCEWPITGTSLASLGGVWGVPDGVAVGTGHAVSRAAVDAIRGLLETWKGAHAWCQAIIFSYDATLFDPMVVNAGNPDGTWGRWSKYVGGVLVPARTGATDGRVRYWTPRNG